MIAKLKPYVIRLGIFSAVVALIIIISKLLLGWWQCPFKYVTGLPCGGCGMLTSADALLHGNFATAWESNPLVFLLVGYIFYLAVMYISGNFRKINYKTQAMLLILVFLLFGLWRIIGIFTGSCMVDFNPNSLLGTMAGSIFH